jgi:starch synthase
MKILLIASEAVPLAKVGGLADVVGALPKALRTLGHDARILVPQYPDVAARFSLVTEIAQYNVRSWGETRAAGINTTVIGGIPVYTLNSPSVFSTSEVYTNDLERFYFFSRAVFEILPQLRWQPDIIHCHDWMTALIVMWARRAGYPYRSLFTIHNLNFQGSFSVDSRVGSELKTDWVHSPPGAPAAPSCFLAQAILWADQINTVSPTYSREISTPEYGLGLDSLLRFRRDNLTGILNGIDHDIWNPLLDAYLPSKYSSERLTNKTLNKTALQTEVGLPVGPDIPLIGMVQRLEEQKGLDIFLEGIDNFLVQSPAQIVLQGKGRLDYHERLNQVVKSHPNQVSVTLEYQEPLAHRIYAGSDLFLMPSRFEPCGLGQMIAMRYATVPVVRHTGGLVDSVPEFSTDLNRGRGFVFHDYSSTALFQTLRKALAVYINNRKLWSSAAQRISRADLSWQASALEYDILYRKLLPSPETNPSPDFNSG